MTQVTTDHPVGAYEDSIDMEAAGISPYTFREKVFRMLWQYIGQMLFGLTFHNWYGARSRILRVFGAEIGENVRIRASVKIEQPWNLKVGRGTSIGDRAIIYCLGKVEIGEYVSISQHVHVCAGTHDHTRCDMPLLRPSIHIRNHCWIAADAFVGPGITVHEGAILGARGCAFRDLEAWKIYVGNPACVLRAREVPRGLDLSRGQQASDERGRVI